MNYYFEVLKKYAIFGGRASRKEYWMFFLLNFIIAFGLGIIGGLLKINPESGRSLLGDLYSLVILVPSIAVGVRRMHDVNKSGWYLLIPIYNFILVITKGTKGDNKYGSEPKETNKEPEKEVI
jgi:uncharacterized membrane protein YhaH (DUF805 family)